jgi:TetR/AcrR family transcriptional repressor of nem operon
MIPKAEATRLRIIESAAELMATRGYGRTGLESILERSAVSKGNFYHHFPSKEDLGFAVLDHLEEGIRNLLRARMANIDDPVARIDAMLDALTETAGARGCRAGCPLGNLAAEMSDVSEAFRTRLLRIFDSWRELVASTLREGCGEAGVTEANVDSLARYVLCSLEGSILLAKVSREFGEIDNAMTHLKAHIRRELAPQPSFYGN